MLFKQSYQEIFMELDKLSVLKMTNLIIEKFISELNIELNFAKLNIDIENELKRSKYHY